MVAGDDRSVYKKVEGLLRYLAEFLLVALF